MGTCSNPVGKGWRGEEVEEEKCKRHQWKKIIIYVASFIQSGQWESVQNEEERFGGCGGGGEYRN